MGASVWMENIGIIRPILGGLKPALEQHEEKNVNERIEWMKKIG